MASIFVTGSTTGLGLAAAEALLDDGHDVVLHARDTRRAGDLGDLASRAAGIVVGDLADLDATRRLADQVNTHGTFDAVIHNAGVYAEPDRNTTPDRFPRTLAVNVLAPYVLTALIRRPRRLVYLSSGLHTSGRTTLDDVEWTRRPWQGVPAYCDSKLLITAFTMAIARRWPDVLANAVDPGWVPTRMGGPDAPDDLSLGHVTQVWLATSDDAAAKTSSGYWYHGARATPAPAVEDVAFQDAVVDLLAGLTGVSC